MPLNFEVSFQKLSIPFSVENLGYVGIYGADYPLDPELPPARVPPPPCCDPEISWGQAFMVSHGGGLVVCGGRARFPNVTESLFSSRCYSWRNPQPEWRKLAGAMRAKHFRGAGVVIGDRVWIFGGMTYPAKQKLRGLDNGKLLNSFDNDSYSKK